ncbi:MAG TPA: DNA starvation/stationary phase protection protein [Bdellovibrionales bacterium]|nr:DNA starvation/stationary phase protection protein [Bdellovibrionales bacterium]
MAKSFDKGHESVAPVSRNPIGLKKDVAEEMCRSLDMHLSALIALFHQYYKHHWLVKGPQFRELHLYFQQNYEKVQKHFDAVAERITMLGGIPSSSMQRQESQSFISEEAEGDRPVREMLRKDLEDEGLLAEKLRESIILAMDGQDFGSEYLLKKILYHCENRAHELDHFLENDSLEPSAARPTRSQH